MTLVSSLLRTVLLLHVPRLLLVQLSSDPVPLLLRGVVPDVDSGGIPLKKLVPMTRRRKSPSPTSLACRTARNEVLLWLSTPLASWCATSARDACSFIQYYEQHDDAGDWR
jgi:hypothetical protein